MVKWFSNLIGVNSVVEPEYIPDCRTGCGDYGALYACDLNYNCFYKGCGC